MSHDNEEYTDAPEGVAEAIAQGRVVPWGEIEKMVEAPTASELAAALRTRKTSISLTEFSIEKFKEAAEKEGVSYQQLIREVLHWYAQNQLDSDAA